MLESKVASLEDNEITGNYDITKYVKRKELKRSISCYRLTLQNMREYGKGYVGHGFEDWWLDYLNKTEKLVFQLRYQQRRKFSDICKLTKISNAHQLYDTAYRKVISRISEEIQKEGI